MGIGIANLHDHPWVKFFELNLAALLEHTQRSKKLVLCILSTSPYL